MKNVNIGHIIFVLSALLLSNYYCFSIQTENDNVNYQDDDFDPNDGLDFYKLLEVYNDEVKHPLFIDSVHTIENKQVKIFLKLYAKKEKSKLMPSSLVFFKDGKRFKTYMFNLDITIEFSEEKKIQKTISNSDVKKAFPNYDAYYFRYGRISSISIEKILEDRLILGLNFSIPITDLGFYFYYTINKNGEVNISEKEPK